MKKIVCMLLVILMIVSLCACGNENWGPGNYSYRHAHISDGTNGYCVTVTSWHDNDLGIELHTKEFGSIYCSEGTYFLFEDGAKCPFCRGN
jgi:hypothetical protein